MSVAATQWLAFAITAAVGAGTSGYFDMHPLAGVAAIYVLVFPAMVIHFLCSLLESKESRWEAARCEPAIDFDAEASRIENAGYPEQHRLFLENKLQRAQFRNVHARVGEADHSQESAPSKRERELEVAVEALQAQYDRKVREADVHARRAVAGQLEALKSRPSAPREEFDEAAVYEVARLRYLHETRATRKGDPEVLTPHVACSVCGGRIPECLASCWYCSAPLS